MRCTDWIKLILIFENKEFVVMGKGDQEKVAIFSEEAKDYLIRYLNTRNDNLDALFISRENNRWSISGIQQYIKRTAINARVKKNMHPHLLRHGCAMLLLDNELSLDEIQKVLGHRNINTTQIYARTSMKRVKKNADNIYNKLL